MLKRAQGYVAPAYLLACLIFGGSAQGIWANMVLQLAGVAVIAWAAVYNCNDPLAPAAKQLLALAGLTILIIALQLVPLPPSIWTHIGPRSSIADGFRILAVPVPFQPLSVTPSASLGALLAFIPPLAMFCAMVRLRGYRANWMALALFGGALAGIVLGALQVANPADVSPWYLYEDTSNGRAVGFFANADHMATLLVITIPFLAATVAAAKSANGRRYSAVVAVAAGLGLLVVVGLGLNGSLAGYGLALPVMGASALLILRPASRMRVWMIGLVAVLVVSAVAALEATAIGSGSIGEHAATASQSRAELVSTTAHAAAEFMPFGSGLGSFRDVYPLFENAEQVTETYVVHAHNDYVEVALELGLPGIVLLLLFLAWWAVAVWRVWRTPEPRPFPRAAAIASGAMLVHSLVDFPLRTAAIAACFSLCAALLADSRPAPADERRELRRKRHVEFR